jgi:monofunctional glycosyltransferase
VRVVMRWVARLLAAILVVVLALVVVYRFVDPPITPLMVIRLLEAAVDQRPARREQRWVPLKDVSPQLVRAVVAGEDARFFTHHGVDWEALSDARADNARHPGRRLRGAGTITMQCARNVFLWPRRSYLRKGLEIALAYVLEVVWGKRRILEVYLNVAEWDDGVYGAEAAAARHFGVPAAALGERQAALLAAVLPNPRRWHPATPGPYVSARAAVIERRAAQVRLPPWITPTGGEDD